MCVAQAPPRRNTGPGFLEEVTPLVWKGSQEQSTRDGVVQVLPVGAKEAGVGFASHVVTAGLTCRLPGSG